MVSSFAGDPPRPAASLRPIGLGSCGTTPGFWSLSWEKLLIQELYWSSSVTLLLISASFESLKNLTKSIYFHSGMDLSSVTKNDSLLILQKKGHVPIIWKEDSSSSSQNLQILSSSSIRMSQILEEWKSYVKPLFRVPQRFGDQNISWNQQIQ